MSRTNHPAVSDLQEFNCKFTVEEWSVCYRQGNLLDALMKHWKVYVPHIYGHNDDSVKEERMAKKLLFKPMEIFLCDSNDPDSVLQSIKDSDKPAQICGHVFKSGEPTYSCRDCASDPTCVLCIECFEKSTHREHRYRINMSGGGGYCDCGDAEAWKLNACCNKHAQSSETGGISNPVELLSDGLVDRASTLFLSTLRYAVELLTWEHSDHLPAGLQPQGELTDTYVTMLFNDEIHTYDQVISSLTKAIGCSHSEATEFATVVDREGRSQVKVGSFQDCERARAVIERATSRQLVKSLKVQVMHSRVVAFQKFALQIIPWLRNILSHSDGLRRLFCILSMQTQGDGKSLLLRMLLADTLLWKVARIQCHQLFMTGVLKDQECKIQFATMFTQNYGEMQRNFINDDHDHDVSVTNLSIQVFTVTSVHYNDIMRAFILDDHYRSVSISSISVQIFTVPTLARMLITEHDLLGVIMRSFLEHCQGKKNAHGKLSFQQTTTDRNHGIKRAWYMLYDYKYALLSKPLSSEWSDNMRAHYHSGFCALVDLLQAMQGMDAVTRQTGQHLEFEPEWESAFNLQLKLNDILQLIIHWSTSDKHVLIESYKHCLETLLASGDYKTHIFEACGRTVEAIQYDVSSQPVSIHIPVSRLFAALHVYLSKFNLAFDSPELYQTGVLPKDLIEMPLRVRVLVSQAHAGMWRRNGYSLVNQIFFYHNVKCRMQMHDKDILMLQIGAALMPNDDFLLHVMNKFGLSQWSNKTYVASLGQEDKLSRTVTMAEEFLTLLIHILSERYVEGLADISEHSVVKREIIHQLCISSLTHSELAKALPEDENNETGMEEVVNEVATFKVPSDKDKGKYELKEMYYDDYSMYFYHYSKAEQSKSEEVQLKRKRQASQSLALRPPLPPAFTQYFSQITQLLQCDTMIYIIEMVLIRAQTRTSRFWSEPQLERILHIIGLALHEQKRSMEQNTSFDFILKATKEGENILSLLEGLVGGNVITHDSHKDLLTWLLQIFADIRQLKNKPVSSDEAMEGVLSPHMRLADEKKRKSVRAEKRRLKIMTQMSAMQRSFIQDNTELFENTDTDLGGVDVDSRDGYPPADQLVALGSARSQPQQVAIAKVTCILCQEEQEIKLTSKPMVLATFVQQSTVMSKTDKSGADLLQDPLFMDTNLACGIHTSTCGHAMHAECWQSLYETIMSRERRRSLRMRQQLSYNIDRSEFMCPLCEFLSNSVCPIVPSLSSLLPNNDEMKIQLTLNDWLDGIEKTVKPCISATQSADNIEDTTLLLPCPMTSITKMMAESVARNFQLLWKYVSLDKTSGNFSDGIKEMIKKFAKDIYAHGSGSENTTEMSEDDSRISVMSWSTCAFTIKVIEQVLRFEGQSIDNLTSRQHDCLSVLINFAAIVNQTVPQDAIRDYCVRLIHALIPPDDKSNINLLDMDMFHYLTLLIMSLPSLHCEADLTSATVPTAGINDHHTLQFTLTAHLVQIMFSPQTHDLDEDMDMDMDTLSMPDTEAEALLVVYADLHAKAGFQGGVRLPKGRQLLTHTQQSCLPFLRSAALLFHYISGVALPAFPGTPESREFEILCGYLSLSKSLSSLFLSQGDVITQLIDRWCENNWFKSRVTCHAEPLLPYPVAIRTLVPLPVDYSDLVNTASLFTCPRSNGDDSRAPTMCLVCRKMLCSQSYCCQTLLAGMSVGAVTHHAYTCGAGTGIFLRVRDCQILLLTGKVKGCFYAPPYLDNYGETDEGLRRGNPLYLSQEAYRRLQLLWLNHGITEEIGHQLEAHSSLLGIDWQHL